jgi:putative alpha-1,2-mannosidase
VSVDDEDKAASLTLTYAFDDWILGRVTEELLLGKEEHERERERERGSNKMKEPEKEKKKARGADYLADVASDAFNRSLNYRNLWSADEQLLCPRRGGPAADEQLLCPASETAVRDKTYYTEGDALHWLFFVPHDPPGLAALFPSLEAFDARIEGLFEGAAAFLEDWAHAEGIPNPYYWAGNEHDLLDVWLFAFGADCAKTQKWSRWLTHAHYDVHRKGYEHADDDRRLGGGRGIPGNDDYGALSSWFLFASLGVYPRAGTDLFFVGSPRVASASLRLNKALPGSSSNGDDDGGDASTSLLQIITHNNSATRVFVEALLVNGEPHRSPFLTRSDLTRPGGSVLEFFMSDQPASSLCPLGS